LKICAVLSVLLFSLALVGCGGDDDPAAPNRSSNPGPAGMSANIDGQAWTSVATQAINQGGVVGVGGSENGGALGLGIGFVGSTTGTYEIGPGHISSGTVTSLTGDGWSANSNQGNGTITVTTLTTTRVAGTFSFTAPAVASGTDPPTRMVTEGSFDVEF